MICFFEIIPDITWLDLPLKPLYLLKQNLLVKTTSSTEHHQWSWKLGLDIMVSPSVDHLWFIAQPRLLHWWWSYRLICSSISLASLSQAMFQQRYSSGHDLRKPMLHQHESICLEFPHLRDVILGMTPPPTVIFINPNTDRGSLVA